MRSVVVVFPASMWAMMPMFLQRSNGTVLDTLFFRSSLRTSCSPMVLTGLLIEIQLLLLALAFLRSRVNSANSAVKSSSPQKAQRNSARSQRKPLPPVMRKRLIGLGHAVYILFLLDRRPFAVGRVEQF